MIHIGLKTYPLPTPATYPKGAGTPKKCFLFRVFNETEGTAIFWYYFFSAEKIAQIHCQY